MNQLLKTTGIMVCFVLVFMTMQAGSTEVFQRIVSKNFSVSENATLKVENVFGSIIISEWDKNEISFTVTIEVTAKEQSVAQELANNVNINFTQEGNIVSAKTRCPSFKNDCNRTQQWTLFHRSLISKSSTCNCTYKIGYQISVPKRVNYELNNKYGNVVMENAIGNVNISLLYGDLLGGDFSGNSKIDIRYGGMTLKKYPESMTN